MIDPKELIERVMQGESAEIVVHGVEARDIPEFTAFAQQVKDALPKTEVYLDRRFGGEPTIFIRYPTIEQGKKEAPNNVWNNHPKGVLLTVSPVGGVGKARIEILVINYKVRKAVVAKFARPLGWRGATGNYSMIIRTLSKMFEDLIKWEPEGTKP